MTRPERKDMPAQRINIDVCAIPSYQPRPMMLINPYGIDMGTSGLIIQAQSREEIFTDKLLAFALRPNRIKYRDLWDMAWLHQQAVQPAWHLLDNKLRDHRCEKQRYEQLLQERCNQLHSDARLAQEFRAEMRRFLPMQIVKDVTDRPEFWSVLVYLVTGWAQHILSKR